MAKKIALSILLGVSVLCVPAVALAHVIVTPKQAGIGQEVTFNVSVPNERQTPVTNLKLIIPNGVTDVTPTVKAGWTIAAADNGNTKDPEVTEINWSGGNIPAGQRDDFTFSAQLPGQSTSVDWKAYQTYADGTIVHWDQKPTGSDDADGNAGPYSVTSVVNDLAGSDSDSKSSTSPLAAWALMVSIIALITGGISLGVRKR